MSASKIKTIKDIIDQNQITGEREKYTSYIKNEISKLEKILNKKGLKDEESIKKRGLKYLRELALGWRKYKGLTIPTFTEKDKIGELALKWRKYKGLTNQEEITEARKKRYFWMINYYKHYKRGSQEKTLHKKISKPKVYVDKYNEGGDLIKTINDDKKKPHKGLIGKVNDDEKESWGDLIEKVDDDENGSYKTLIEMINAGVKPKKIYSEICHGKILVKESDEQVMSFLKAHYVYNQIKGAISSGKVHIMKNVCRELLVWINSKIKNKKYHNKNSLEEMPKIEEQIGIKSIMYLLNKGANRGLYGKDERISALKECVSKKEYVNIIVKEIKKEISKK